MPSLIPFALLLHLAFWTIPPQSARFIEREGRLQVEAEDLHRQTHDALRRWHRVDAQSTPQVGPDADGNHAATASGGAYLEVLPDSRANHDQELVTGENFSNQPGQLAVLHYDTYFYTPGRYYIWVRAYSTGTEDNGLHVGFDGTWPESGQRMQWCDGKHAWTWASKQRTPEEHCGVERLIYLDIPEAGPHTISFSMREDGFEFDQWVASLEYAVPGN